MSRLYRVQRIVKAIKAALLWPLTCTNWIAGVGAYLGLDRRGKDVVYHLRNGLQLVSDGSPEDLQVIREVFVHKTYMLDEIDFSKVETVVDCGAHRGYVGVALAQCARKGARVVCLEPEPTNFSYLQKNIVQNGFQDKMIADNAGIYAQDGPRAFYVSPNNHSHSLDLAHVDHGQKIEILCKSISTIMRDHNWQRIDLLKMDIEGAEFEVLFTLDKKLLESIKYILVEGHTTEDHTRDDMVDFLRSNGFDCILPYEFEDTIVAVGR